MRKEPASNFYFNSDKYDFWEIYERIKLFYPIGIEKSDQGLYHAYPGIKRLQEALVDNFHNEENFAARWTSFCKPLAGELRKEPVNTTYGQKPAFSAFVELGKTEYDDLIRRKELHFFVSVLGPFYTVIGCDANTLKLDALQYTSTNYLVVSPEHEFAAPFSRLCEIIEAKFKGFRFVPFSICEVTINGLSVRDTEEDSSSIFNALFGDFLVNHSALTIGIGYYKCEDWIKKGYVDDGQRWTGSTPTDFNS